MLMFAEKTARRRKSLKAGQRVSKKYQRAHRRKLQRQEYERLKSVLPTLSARAEVDEVEVVEEAIQYIDYLHAEIMRRMLNGE